jgi:hypothetical protein
LEHPDVDAVSGGAYYIDAAGKVLRHGLGFCSTGVPATFDYLRFYGQDGIFQQATFWRRSAYEAVGGIDRSLRFVMDLDLFAKLAKRQPFARLPHFLACFRLHEECKTLTIQRVRLQETAEFEVRHGVTKHNGVTRRALYWRYRLPSLARKVYVRMLFGAGLIS